MPITLDQLTPGMIDAHDDSGLPLLINCPSCGGHGVNEYQTSHIPWRAARTLDCHVCDGEGVIDFNEVGEDFYREFAASPAVKYRVAQEAAVRARLNELIELGGIAS